MANKKIGATIALEGEKEFRTLNDAPFLAGHSSKGSAGKVGS